MKVYWKLLRVTTTKAAARAQLSPLAGLEF